MMNRLTIFMTTLLISSFTQADIQLTSVDQGGDISTITSNGHLIRMDNKNDSQFVLIDTRQQQLKMVDPQRRQVMLVDLKKSKQAVNQSSRVKVNYRKLGQGPKIAGYDTTQYSVTANGKPCNTVFISQQVMNKAGISELFDAMQTMQQQTENMMGGMSSMLDECTQADLQSYEFFKSRGAPLKTLDSNGQIESEITSINNNAKINSAYYQVPAGYQQVSMQQQMEQARQQMQQNMPDMNQIMQQMQQNGSIPPEAMEQMKKMQEMFQQPQQ